MNTNERTLPPLPPVHFVLFGGLLLVMLRKLAVQMGRLDGDLSVYYHASNELTGGVSPYWHGTPYIYPPLFAWLISPLAQLTPLGYAIAWGLVLGACWIASVLLIRRLTGRSGWMVDVLPSVLLFRCIWNGWGHGQVTLLLSAMILAFMVLARERKMAGASLWLAFAGAMKVFPFYLGVFYLNLRSARWIPLLGAWTIGLSVLPALTVGPFELLAMVRDGFFGPSMSRIGREHALPMNHAPIPHLFQLVGSGYDGLNACLLVCMLFTTALLLWSGPRSEERDEHGLWASLAMTSMLIVCPHVWMHYFTLLLYPFAAASVYVSERRHESGARVLLAGLAVASVAFNAGARLFVSSRLSARIDATGVLSIGLVAFWAALAYAVIARRAAGHAVERGERSDAELVLQAA